jgi:hypothetical protein
MVTLPPRPEFNLYCPTHGRWDQLAPVSSAHLLVSALVCADYYHPPDFLGHHKRCPLEIRDQRGHYCDRYTVRWETERFVLRHELRSNHLCDNERCLQCRRILELLTPWKEASHG